MNEMNRLIIATGNTHKTEEIRKLLGSIFENIEDLQSYPEIGEIDEIGSTFQENAELKALEVGKALGDSTLILSDDSGLEVDALDGAPGVRSRAVQPRTTLRCLPRRSGARRSRTCRRVL